MNVQLIIISNKVRKKEMQYKSVIRFIPGGSAQNHKTRATSILTHIGQTIRKEHSDMLRGDVFSFVALSSARYTEEAITPVNKIFSF